MALIWLDDYEREVLRFLADRYDRGGTRIDLREFPRFEEVGEEEVYRVVARFQNHFWLTPDTCSSWTIWPAVLNAVEQLDHPPPVDYWKSIATWFRSKWWSVPFVLFLVVLPLLVQWVDMIKALLRWMGL